MNVRRWRAGWSSTAPRWRVKCQGLDDEQLRSASVPPSRLTLLGLVQHAAEVERNWFRRVLTGDDAPPIFGPRDPNGHDGGFELSEQSSFRVAEQIWQDEIKQARRNCAVRALMTPPPSWVVRSAWRWIYTHMIAEYARHCGHADLVRERIDGHVGAWRRTPACSTPVRSVIPGVGPPMRVTAVAARQRSAWSAWSNHCPARR